MTQHIQHGVEYGCAVSVSSGLVLSVAAGGIINQNHSASVSAQTFTAASGDATFDRYDLLVADSAGNISAVTGTADGNVNQPDSTDVKLAAYIVRAAATSVAAADLQDLRTFALRHISPYRVSGLWYGSPNTLGGSYGVWTNNDMFLTPFFVGRQLGLQGIGMGVPGTGAGTTGSVGRLGIYRDDGAGGLSLLIDAGTVPLDASGSHSASISVTLDPGWWWLACAFQSLGATKPTVYSCRPLGINTPVGAATQSQAMTDNYGGIKFAAISGALPATPSSPDYSAANYPSVVVQAS